MVEFPGTRAHRMAPENSGRLTDLLSRFHRGEEGADTKLMVRVYRELHRRARMAARGDPQGQSLQPTALVNQTYLRLVQQRSKSTETPRPRPWKNRTHFFAIAARMMREILIDQARHLRAGKRGGNKPHVRIDTPAVQGLPGLSVGPQANEDVMAVHEALTQLAGIDPRQSRIVELHWFAGMSARDIAKEVGVSERTVNRELKAALQWLYKRLRSLD
jgi:RNA polymerase sigma-70 factor, ECF subfamily